MSALSFHEFNAAKKRVEDLVKIYPANNSHAPQFVPEARMVIDADPAEPTQMDGIEHVTTRQMAAACAVLFVVSFAPWWP